MKKFRWTVEFTVDETWVADGFNIDRERARSIIQGALAYSYSHETNARVLKAPANKDIAKAQGYKTVAAWKASNK